MKFRVHYVYYQGRYWVRQYTVITEHTMWSRGAYNAVPFSYPYQRPYHTIG